ncbi:dihydropteroate synthase [Sphingosinicella soli]|uniref:dihydropteroate synthase n=1 Tax=Sphingosinicella soli TaxID=333708 RepID=A0A7W7B346_9SPHN|nr:dihydropteroate synthase [Sphingosinicella soli]MBB4632160.1 dihydropteroate synthase [Sphingosinicella soli]
MKTYYRPTGFVDAPFGYDGQVQRLAGGLVWFSAVEVIERSGGKRVSQRLVPVSDIDTAHPLWARLTAPRAPLQLGARTVRFSEPSVMAILNRTPDSFSDGGQHASDDDAAAAAVAMAADGAAIIDIGGESTRPGAAEVWEQDEIGRVAPLVERLARAGIAVSIDTRKSAVMADALRRGAAMVNDVSGLTHDDRALETVAGAGCPVVIMHTQGGPETMQQDPAYADALLDVYDWLEARIDAAVAGGIAREKIIVDPGIGFGKTVRHNLEILNGLSLFHGLGVPVLLGASRKRIVGALSNEAPVDRRLGGSLALVMTAIVQGVQMVRVHDAFESVQAIRVWRGLRDAALSPPTL